MHGPTLPSTQDPAFDPSSCVCVASEWDIVWQKAKYRVPESVSDPTGLILGSPEPVSDPPEPIPDWPGAPSGPPEPLSRSPELVSEWRGPRLNRPGLVSDSPRFRPPSPELFTCPPRPFSRSPARRLHPPESPLGTRGTGHFPLHGRRAKRKIDPILPFS